MREATLRGHRDFAQVELVNDRLVAVRRGAHSKVTGSGAMAQGSMWAGVTIAGFATFVLGLYSIYRLLSGVFVGEQVPSGPVLPTLILGALALGLCLSVAAFLVMLLQARRRRDHHAARPDASIAA